MILPRTKWPKCFRQMASASVQVAGFSKYLMKIGDVKSCRSHGSVEYVNWKGTQNNQKSQIFLLLVLLFVCFCEGIVVTRHSFKMIFIYLAFLEIEWRFHNEWIWIFHSQFGAQKQINRAKKQPQELAKCRTLEKTSELIVLAIRIGERSISYVVWTCGGVHNLLYQQWKNHQIWLMIFMKNNRDPIVEEKWLRNILSSSTPFSGI